MSAKATYAIKNGGKYNFIIASNTSISLPDDKKFWNDFLSTGKSWSLIMYEQDWMSTEVMRLQELQSDLMLGERWLQQMGKGAEKNRLTIQYGNSLPRQVLQSLTIPSVTQTRVSADYLKVADQWKIGVSSIFASSLGLAPSKDTLWTQESQPRNPYGATELYPDLQVLVAVLSTGPVGVGDAINGTDRELLMRCCNENGLILKPSKPATAVDAQLIESAFQDGSGVAGDLWTTYSQFDDVNMRFGIILAVNTSNDYMLTRTESGLVPFPDDYKYVVFNANGLETIEQFDEEHPLNVTACGMGGTTHYCLYYTSPVVTIDDTEVIILGDLDKFVPMSPQRIYKIYVTDDAVALTLRGQSGEVIAVNYTLNGTRQVLSESASSLGCADFVLYETPGTSFKFPSGNDCHWELTTTPVPPTPSTTTTIATTTSKIMSTTVATSTVETTTFASACKNGLGSILLIIVALVAVMQ